MGYSRQTASANDILLAKRQYGCLDSYRVVEKVLNKFMFLNLLQANLRFDQRSKSSKRCYLHALCSVRCTDFSVALVIRPQRSMDHVQPSKL
jgi:hypothetical protein